MVEAVICPDSIIYTGGLATIIGRWVVNLACPAGPLALLASLVILTTLLSQAMNGATVAAMIVPVGIGAASQVGLDPGSVTLSIALATTIAFITPLGHPLNILVIGSGGYQMRDYARVGLPLSIIILAILIFLLPIFWLLSLSVG